MSVFCNFIAKLYAYRKVYLLQVYKSIQMLIQNKYLDLYKFCILIQILFYLFYAFTPITLKFLQIPVSLAKYCNNQWKIKKTYAYLTVKTFLTV